MLLTVLEETESSIVCGERGRHWARLWPPAESQTQRLNTIIYVSCKKDGLLWPAHWKAWTLPLGVSATFPPRTCGVFFIFNNGFLAAEATNPFEQSCLLMIL